MTTLPEPRTLVEMLGGRGQTTPEQTAFIFEDRPWTYGWLWERATRFATHLRRADVQAGDRVVMALPNGPAFFYAFYGILRLGAIAVPIFPGSNPARCQTLMRLCDARHLVVPAGLPDEQAAAFQKMARHHALTLIPAADDVADAAPEAFPEPDPDAVAFIQYTSGSTADPRGVQLTHANVLTNVRQMIAGMRITPADVFVSWLPAYHDMGLILKTMAPFYLGARLILLPTSLRHVHPWLQAIQQHRGTFTAAPDIAYRLCVRSIRNPEQYDLSSLRVALNAAEPVRSRTMEAFEQAFGLRHVMVAGYGLAEATVGVSMWPPGTPQKVDADGHVSVGPPFPDIDVQIVEGDQSLQAGSVGEIAIRSPANTSGYYDNPAANAGLRWHDTYILTGDLGYLDEAGDLFVVARKKNLIIQAGRSLYPGDVEDVVHPLPEVRHVAAVGVDRRGAGEQLYLFVELWRHHAPDEAHSQRLIADIVQRIYGRFGLRPGRVYLLKPKTLPFTPNGKLQHQKLKMMYLDETLHESGRILYPRY